MYNRTLYTAVAQQGHGSEKIEPQTSPQTANDIA